MEQNIKLNASRMDLHVKKMLIVVLTFVMVNILVLQCKFVFIAANRFQHVMEIVLARLVEHVCVQNNKIKLTSHSTVQIQNGIQIAVSV